MALIEKLTAIADAIREKTGKTDGMTLDQMPGEIESIETGGGSGGGELDALFDKTITVARSNATQIPNEVFRDCKALVSAEFPNVTSIGSSAFNACTNMTTLTAPNVTTIGGSAFQMCKILTAIDFPLVTSIGNNAFYSCSALASHVCLPLLTTIEQRIFQGCTALPSVDLPKVTSIDIYGFYENRALKAVILRSETVCTLKNTTGFGNCWLIERGTGFFYVPKALVEEYQAATNWSTWATQFRALEDYTVDGTITGELDPNKI